MDMSMSSRFKRAWNTFFNRDPTHSYNDTGPGYFYRPDRTRFSRGKTGVKISKISCLVQSMESLIPMVRSALHS